MSQYAWQCPLRNNLMLMLKMLHHASPELCDWARGSCCWPSNAAAICFSSSCSSKDGLLSQDPAQSALVLVLDGAC